jgi:hypothetical protein
MATNLIAPLLCILNYYYLIVTISFLVLFSRMWKRHFTLRENRLQIYYFFLRKKVSYNYFLFSASSSLWQHPSVSPICDALEFSPEED